MTMELSRRYETMRVIRSESVGSGERRKRRRTLPQAIEDHAHFFSGVGVLGNDPGNEEWRLAPAIEGLKREVKNELETETKKNLDGNFAIVGELIMAHAKRQDANLMEVRRNVIRITKELEDRIVGVTMREDAASREWRKQGADVRDEMRILRESTKIATKVNGKRLEKVELQTEKCGSVLEDNTRRVKNDIEFLGNEVSIVRERQSENEKQQEGYVKRMTLERRAWETNQGSAILSLQSMHENTLVKMGSIEDVINSIERQVKEVVEVYADVEDRITALGVVSQTIKEMRSTMSGEQMKRREEFEEWKEEVRKDIMKKGYWRERECDDRDGGGGPPIRLPPTDPGPYDEYGVSAGAGRARNPEGCWRGLKDYSIIDEKADFENYEETSFSDAGRFFCPYFGHGLKLESRGHRLEDGLADKLHTSMRPDELTGISKLSEMTNLTSMTRNIEEELDLRSRGEVISVLQERKIFRILLGIMSDDEKFTFFNGRLISETNRATHTIENYIIRLAEVTRMVVDEDVAAERSYHGLRRNPGGTLRAAVDRLAAVSLRAKKSWLAKNFADRRTRHFELIEKLKMTSDELERLTTYYKISTLTLEQVRNFFAVVSENLKASGKQYATATSTYNVNESPDQNLEAEEYEEYREDANQGEWETQGGEVDAYYTEKGKGKFQGNCNYCKEYGHRKSECEKYTRFINGKNRPKGGGKSNGFSPGGKGPKGAKGKKGNGKGLRRFVYMVDADDRIVSEEFEAFPVDPTPGPEAVQSSGSSSQERSSEGITAQFVSLSATETVGTSMSPTSRAGTSQISSLMCEVWECDESYFDKFSSKPMVWIKLMLIAIVLMLTNSPPTNVTDVLATVIVEDNDAPSCAVNRTEIEGSAFPEFREDEGFVGNMMTDLDTGDRTQELLRENSIPLVVKKVSLKARGVGGIAAISKNLITYGHLCGRVSRVSILMGKDLPSLIGRTFMKSFLINHIRMVDDIGRYVEYSCLHNVSDYRNEVCSQRSGVFWSPFQFSDISKATIKEVELKEPLSKWAEEIKGTAILKSMVAEEDMSVCDMVKRRDYLNLKIEGAKAREALTTEVAEEGQFEQQHATNELKKETKKLREVREIMKDFERCKLKRDELKKKMHVSTLAHWMGYKVTDSAIATLAKDCRLPIEEIRKILQSMCEDSGDLAGVGRRHRRGNHMKIGKWYGYNSAFLAMIDSFVVPWVESINLAVGVLVKPASSLVVMCAYGPTYKNDLRRYWELTSRTGLAGLEGLFSKPAQEPGMKDEKSHPTAADTRLLLLISDLLRVKFSDILMDQGSENLGGTLLDDLITRDVGVGVAPSGVTSMTPAVERSIQECRNADRSASTNRVLCALKRVSPFEYYLRLSHQLNNQPRRRTGGLSPYQREEQFGGYTLYRRDANEFRTDHRSAMLDKHFRREVECCGEDEEAKRQIQKLEEKHNKRMHNEQYAPGDQAYLLTKRGTGLARQTPVSVVGQIKTPLENLVTVKSHRGILHREVPATSVAKRYVYGGVETLPLYKRIKSMQDVEEVEGKLVKFEEEIASSEGYRWIQCEVCGCFRKVETDFQVKDGFVCADLDRCNCSEACDRIVSRTGCAVPLRKVRTSKVKEVKWKKKYELRKDNGVLMEVESGPVQTPQHASSSSAPAQTEGGRIKELLDAGKEVTKKNKKATKEKAEAQRIASQNPVTERELNQIKDDSESGVDLSVLYDSEEDEVGDQDGSIRRDAQKKEKSGKSADVNANATSVELDNHGNIKEVFCNVGEINDGFTMERCTRLHDLCREHGNGKVDLFKNLAIKQLAECACDYEKVRQVIVRVSGKHVPEVEDKKNEMLFIVEKSGAHRIADTRERVKGRSHVAVSIILEPRAELDSKTKEMLNKSGKIAVASLGRDLLMRGLSRGKIANVDAKLIRGAMGDKYIMERINAEVSGLTETRLTGSRNARPAPADEVAYVKKSGSHDRLSTKLLADVKDVRYETINGILMVTGIVKFRLVPGGFAQTRRRVCDSPTISALQLRVLIVWSLISKSTYVSFGDVSRAFNLNRPESPHEQCVLTSPKNMSEFIDDTMHEGLIWNQSGLMMTSVSIYGTLLGASEWFCTFSDHLRKECRLEQHWMARSMFRTDFRETERSKESEDRAMVGIHVDDLIVAAWTEAAGKQVERNVDRKFPVKSWQILCGGRGDAKRRTVEYCGRDLITWVEHGIEVNEQGKSESMSIRYIRIDVSRKIEELRYLTLEVDESTAASRKKSWDEQCTPKELAAFRGIVGSLGFILEWYPQLYAKRKLTIHKVGANSTKGLLAKVNDLIWELKLDPTGSWCARSITPGRPVEFSDASMQLSEAELIELKQAGKSLSEVEKSGRYPIMGRLLGVLHNQMNLRFDQQHDPVVVPLDFESSRLARRVWTIHSGEIVAMRVCRCDNALGRRLFSWACRREFDSDLVTDSDSSTKSVVSHGVLSDTPSECFNSLMELREQYERQYFSLVYTSDENNLCDLLTKVTADNDKSRRFCHWIRTNVYQTASNDKTTKRVELYRKNTEKTVKEIVDELALNDEATIGESEEVESTSEPVHNEWFVGSLADVHHGFKHMGK